MVVGTTFLLVACELPEKMARSSPDPFEEAMQRAHDANGIGDWATAAQEFKVAIELKSAELRSQGVDAEAVLPAPYLTLTGDRKHPADSLPARFPPCRTHPAMGKTQAEDRESLQKRDDRQVQEVQEFLRGLGDGTEPGSDPDSDALRQHKLAQLFQARVGLALQFSNLGQISIANAEFTRASTPRFLFTGPLNVALCRHYHAMHLINQVRMAGGIRHDYDEALLKHARAELTAAEVDYRRAIPDSFRPQPKTVRLGLEFETKPSVSRQSFDYLSGPVDYPTIRALYGVLSVKRAQFAIMALENRKKSEEHQAELVREALEIEAFANEYRLSLAREAVYFYRSTASALLDNAIRQFDVARHPGTGTIGWLQRIVGANLDLRQSEARWEKALAELERRPDRADAAPIKARLLLQRARLLLLHPSRFLEGIELCERATEALIRSEYAVRASDVIPCLLMMSQATAGDRQQDIRWKMFQLAQLSHGGGASLLERRGAKVGGPVAPDAIFRILKQREALVLIVTSAEDGWVFLLRDGVVDVRRLEAGAARDIASNVSIILAPTKFTKTPDGQPATLPVTPRFFEAAADLYQLLLKDVESGLKGADGVTIIADGVLQTLPFELLIIDPASPRSMSEAAFMVKQDYTISYASSVGRFYAGRTSPVMAAPTRRWVGFGEALKLSDQQRAALYPEARCYDTKSAEVLKSLPIPENTRVQLEKVRQALGGARNDMFIEKDYTRQTYRNSTAVTEARVLHFASHAIMPSEADCQTEPALMTSFDSSDGPPRFLSASDIRERVERLRADLVILSACNSGQGQVRDGGEQLTNLAESFQLAGARSVLATHWTVTDIATGDLIVNTMTRVSEDPSLTVPNALRQAKLRMLAAPAQDRYDPSHPVHWASMVFFGDNRVVIPVR